MYKIVRILFFGIQEGNHDTRRMISIVQISFYITNDAEVEMYFGYKKENAIYSF